MDIYSLKNLTGNSTVTFNEQESVKKAREDFRYVCGQSNCIAAPNLNYLAVTRNSVKLADFLPVPFETEKKTLTIPANLIQTDNPKMYAALVCYTGGNPVDVLLYSSAYFAKPTNPVKFDKKRDEYVIKIKDIAKERKVSFGAVIQSL